MHHGALALARAAFKAYLDKDRRALESLLDDDFHFTSPLDNALDRATYLRLCWPNSQAMQAVDEIHGIESGDRAVVVYEVRTPAGKRFRNTELHTARDGKLVSVEVYFGWDLPHRAAPGGHVDNDGHGAG